MEGGPREGLGPTQGHIASESFPSANPRPILFLTKPLVASRQPEGREEIAPASSPTLSKLTVTLTEGWGLPLEGFLVLSTGWDPPRPPKWAAPGQGPQWFQSCPRLVFSQGQYLHWTGTSSPCGLLPIPFLDLPLLSASLLTFSSQQNAASSRKPSQTRHPHHSSSCYRVNVGSFVWQGLKQLFSDSPGPITGPGSR